MFPKNFQRNCDFVTHEADRHELTDKTCTASNQTE